MEGRQLHAKKLKELREKLLHRYSEIVKNKMGLRLLLSSLAYCFGMKEKLKLHAPALQSLSQNLSLSLTLTTMRPDWI